MRRRKINPKREYITSTRTVVLGFQDVLDLDISDKDLAKMFHPGGEWRYKTTYPDKEDGFSWKEVLSTNNDLRTIVVEYEKVEHL